MSPTKSGVLQSLAALSLCVPMLFSQSAEAKTKKRSHVASAGHYFVPPPPPYTPSILPERMLSATRNDQAASAEEEAKPVNPYSKYIFTRNQDDMPRVVKPNPYVAYYHKS